MCPKFKALRRKGDVVVTEAEWFETKGVMMEKPANEVGLSKLYYLLYYCIILLLYYLKVACS